MHYHHRQRGAAIMVIMVPVLILLAAELGQQTNGLLIAVFGFLAFTLVLFSSLTVQVDRGSLRWFFGPGFWRKSVALSEIAGVSAVRTKWYWGLGVRLTPQGWLYNVSGLSAVALQLKDGGAVLIGTDDAEGLKRAIQHGIQSQA
ncbi:hypothetical protein KUV89_08000 [Marinobacter hydrocarbonoclasticus]|nr:hypothetical protein [Marinobacter nauticus]